MSPLARRLALLRILADVQPYALPAAQLLAELNRLVRPALSLVEFAELLSWLQGKAYIDFLPDALDPENAEARKWLIKEAGLAALKS